MSVGTSTNLDRLSPAARSRLALEVLTTYLQVRRQMRQDDTRRAVRALRSYAARSGIHLEAGRDQELVAAWRLAQATKKVLVRLPSDSRCLFSSLTLMCLLERRGIEHVVVIAVRPGPFIAHAWVEVHGQAVLPGGEPGYERLLEL
jgi:hypothetical protein